MGSLFSIAFIKNNYMKEKVEELEKILTEKGEEWRQLEIGEVKLIYEGKYENLSGERRPGRRRNHV